MRTLKYWDWLEWRNPYILACWN